MKNKQNKHVACSCLINESANDKFMILLRWITGVFILKVRPWGGLLVSRYEFESLGYSSWWGGLGGHSGSQYLNIVFIIWYITRELHSKKEIRNNYLQIYIMHDMFLILLESLKLSWIKCYLPWSVWYHTQCISCAWPLFTFWGNVWIRLIAF